MFIAASGTILFFFASDWQITIACIVYCFLLWAELYIIVRFNKKVLAISKNAMFRGKQKEIVYVLSDKIEV